MSGGFRVGDRLSLAILGLCCGGTFIALALTSVAKRLGQTGPPDKPDFPWLKASESQFEDRLKGLTIGGGSGTPAAASSSSAAPKRSSGGPGSAEAAATRAAAAAASSGGKAST